MRFAAVLCLLGLVAAVPKEAAPKSHHHKPAKIAAIQQGSPTVERVDQKQGKCPEPQIWHWDTVSGKEFCLRPEPVVSEYGTRCPPPYELDGQYHYSLLQSQHWELRPLGWDEMVDMDKEELREFMKSHQVPFSIRTKVLDHHDERAFACFDYARKQLDDSKTTRDDCESAGMRWTQSAKGKKCVPMPPYCKTPWNFNFEDKKCDPPQPHFRRIKHGVLDDTWISPVLRAFDQGKTNDAARDDVDRIHQAVESNPHDKVMQKARHLDENGVWVWEVNRIATSHG